jgi:hypothetical protein
MAQVRHRLAVGEACHLEIDMFVQTVFDLFKSVTRMHLALLYPSASLAPLYPSLPSHLPHAPLTPQTPLSLSCHRFLPAAWRSMARDTPVLPRSLSLAPSRYGRARWLARSLLLHARELPPPQCPSSLLTSYPRPRSSISMTTEHMVSLLHGSPHMGAIARDAQAVLGAGVHGGEACREAVLGAGCPRYTLARPSLSSLNASPPCTPPIPPHAPPPCTPKLLSTVGR